MVLVEEVHTAHHIGDNIDELNIHFSAELVTRVNIKSKLYVI